MDAFLKNVSIKTKTFLSPSICFAFLLVIGGFTFLNLSSIHDSVRVIADDLSDDAFASNRLLDQIYQKRLAMKNFVQSADESFVQVFTERADGLLDSLATIRESVNGEEEKRLIETLSALNTQYSALFYDVVVPNKRKEIQTFADEITTYGRATRENLSAIMLSAYEDNDPSAAYHGAIVQQHLLLSRMYISKYLVAEQQADAERAISQIVSAQESIVQLAAELQNPQRKEWLQLVSEGIDVFSAGLQTITANVSARKAAVQEMDSIGPQIAELSSSLSRHALSNIDDQSEQISGATTNTKYMILLLSLLSLAVCAAISIVIARAINIPIKQTSAMLEDIASGDGDLTLRLDYKGQDELGVLCRHFNDFADKIQSIITEVANSTIQLSSAAEELSSVSKHTNAGVLEQESALSEIEGNNQRVVSSVDKVSSRATIASDAAESTSSDSSSILVTMGNTVSNVTELAADLERSNAVISDLQKESDNIGRVLEFITSITDQINLLALNAAIEAARAGEAGRGFAVVADEVRTLAKRTKDSTEEIESSIGSLTRYVRLATESLARNKVGASATVESARVAQTQISEITKKIAEIKSCNDDIFAAVNEQEHSFTLVSTGLSKIKNVTEQTKLSSTQSAEASNELTRLSVNLQSIVEQFNVS